MDFKNENQIWANLQTFADRLEVCVRPCVQLDPRLHQQDCVGHPWSRYINSYMYMYVINLVVQLHVQCTSIHEPHGYQYIIIYCTTMAQLDVHQYIWTK